MSTTTDPAGRPKSSPLAAELRGLADSVFPKEKADLVITAEPDSSGQPIEERMAEIIVEHTTAEYRLIPAAKLRETATALDAMCAKHREDAALLAEFMSKVPEDQWPAPLRTSKHILDGARVLAGRAGGGVRQF